MQQNIGSYDAKTRLPEILRRTEAGESFTITNRGKPVADIVPNRDQSEDKVNTAINNILAAKKVAVSDEHLEQLKQSGRK